MLIDGFEKVELLAPAGNFVKLKTVFYYGADAAYIGGKNFSLRSYADNFAEDEIERAVEYAHALKKKLYVTVNIFTKNNDFEKLPNYLRFLYTAGVDAIIVTDPGVIDLATRIVSNLPLHLSTQANVLNKYAADFWLRNGIKRLILAREIKLQEIQQIHAHNPNVEVEVFVHGAMCMAYSGRCLLSNYLTQRDANRGECAHVCRWNYKLTETNNNITDDIEVEEDKNGTYFLNSKDLNLLSDIGNLINAGVISFKIEGRMKSEFYLATVVNAYRRAIDEFIENGEIQNVDSYETELRKVSHRGYTKAFLHGNNIETMSDAGSWSETQSDFVAIVRDYADGCAIVEMRGRFYTGDRVEVISPISFGSSFIIASITNMKGELINDAKRVQELLKIPVPCILSSGDMLRRIS
ncbi:MAG: U32 family peptidase [Christensenellaceae bacterium]|jgi:putative protease|nr:U32 family peptidase [Christensenellaceae bacterium]